MKQYSLYDSLHLFYFYVFTLPSAPRSTKPWITGNKLNCRGTMSPNSMETVFFGPSTGNTAKCSGGTVSRLAQAKQVNIYFKIN